MPDAFAVFAVQALGLGQALDAFLCGLDPVEFVEDEALDDVLRRSRRDRDADLAIGFEDPKVEVFDRFAPEGDGQASDLGLGFHLWGILAFLVTLSLE